jgi:stearoyl-CoA desaturase (delta-9 desaturase)
VAPILFFIAVWYLSLFSQTFFHHRYASHGAFTMSKGWERFFYILAWITQGPSYLSPRSYAIMHRLHHAYADTERDPHSPSFSPNVVHMMWRTYKFYAAIGDGKMQVEERFLKNLPDWPAFDRFAGSWPSRLAWAILYVAFFVQFAVSPWWYLLLPVIFTMCAFHGAVINWFAHKYGYINFRLRNTSMNLLFFDFLMLGESYHNNHHKRPSAVNFGKRWHEIDPVYGVIRLFAWLGIIRLNKLAIVTVVGDGRDSNQHSHTHGHTHEHAH